jgi:GNAT superfamily N-acetyltransferase
MIENTSVLIRNVTSRDLAQVLEIKPLLTEEIFQQRLQMQEKGDAEFLVVEDNGELMCFVLLKWIGKPTHPDYPDLEDLYTKKSSRGKGYASLLVRHCEKVVKERGFFKVGMAANTDPECPARKLYAKLGYKTDGKPEYVDGVYKGAEEWVVDLEKDLT